ncbi:hypothetical protein Pint_33353 [Pistacia integerrima]|uniref:Uncharacterized protein n=1 Tax=Pistacia integerrima TaxID=434235 RepID=A0ACC0X5B0_9ROSI|nr:hypothetical protein Pint_33353 [Pistacia integerrima]
MNLIPSIGTVWKVFLARGVRPELDQCTSHYVINLYLFSPASFCNCLSDAIVDVITQCQKVIELLQSCCEKCNYDSTHCASVSGLLKQIGKR